MTGGGVRRLPPPLPLIVLRATAEYPEFYLAVETLDEYAGLLRLVVEEKFGGGYPLPKRSSLRVDYSHVGVTKTPGWSVVLSATTSV